MCTCLFVLWDVVILVIEKLEKKIANFTYLVYSQWFELDHLTGLYQKDDASCE